MLATVAVKATTVVVACLAGHSAGAGAATVELRPASDSTLNSGAPNQNFADAVDTIAGMQGSRAAFARNRALLRFELQGQLPRGATVVAARLELEVVKTPPNPQSLPFALHRVLESWDASTVTWRDRAAGIPWQSAGGDFVSAPSSRQNLEWLAIYRFESNPRMVADVQEWLEMPDRNHGWIVVCQDELTPFSARRIASVESSGATPPRLWVEYEGGAFDFPRIGRVGRADSQFYLEFSVPPNRTYEVQRRSALAPGGWLTEAIYPAQTTPQVVRYSFPIGTGNNFFRLEAH